MAEDYAGRWCAHIEPLARKREPIVCSILPEGARRQEMGYGGIVEGSVEQDVYPTFYAAVATNTAYDIVTVMLDLYRITRRDRYRECTGDTRFDAALLRWSQLVDESSLMMDQAQISLLVAAHRITGDSRLLERATAMALRGIAVTDSNRVWHHCDSSGRYGFHYLVDAVYHPLLAAVDYATRGGLPIVGLAYQTGGRPGLPNGVAVRSWEPSPDRLILEAVNGADTAVTWRLSPESGRAVRDLAALEAPGTLARDGSEWTVSLPPRGTLRLAGRITRAGDVAAETFPA